MNIDVIHAANLKAGDWYAGQVVPDAPTRLVQEIHRAVRLTGREDYRDEAGQRRVRPLRDGIGALSSIPASRQVMVIRGPFPDDEPRKFKTPAWLHERVNDGYGTDNRHPFWATAEVRRAGVWKLFEREGWTYAYDTQHNAWAHFATPEEADAFTAPLPRGTDIWA